MFLSKAVALSRGTAVASSLPAARRMVIMQQRVAWASTLIVGGEPGVAATQSAVTAAKQMMESDDTLTLLHVGPEPPAQIPDSIQKVVHAKTSSQTPVAETVANAVETVVNNSENDPIISRVVGTSTKFGATVIPRIGALLQASPINDIIQIVDSTTFIRPLYAGNVLAKVECGNGLSVLSIRPTAFDKSPLVDCPTDIVTTMDIEDYANSVCVAQNTGGDSGAARPDLSSADFVISGGRGMGKGENFELLEKLADTLGNTAVGASRAAVDAGMVPNHMQVGQTGVVVAPNLYMAVGISGAIQHLSGMKDSKIIVAINKDPDAPIFQVADYGLVADLFTAIPELTQKLQT